MLRENSNIPKSMHQSQTNEHIIPAVLVGPFYRTGSTLVMELLATSPQIAITRFYPFEYCYLTYLRLLSKFITRTVEPDTDWDTTILQSETQVDILRPFPFYQEHVEKMFDYLPLDENPDYVQDRCFKALWRELSVLIREKQKPPAPPILYYSEKMHNWAYAEFGRLLPIKGIYTLRDPRDVFVSSLEWDRRNAIIEEYRRTGQVLQNEEIQVDLNEAEKWAIGYRKRLQRLKQAYDNPDEIVIQYEKLIGNLPAECARLEQWLGVSLSPDKLNPMQVSLHTTSPSVQASVGRWKKAMPDDLLEIFSKYLGDLLEDFQYE